MNLFIIYLVSNWYPYCWELWKRSFVGSRSRTRFWKSVSCGWNVFYVEILPWGCCGAGRPCSGEDWGRWSAAVPSTVRGYGKGYLARGTPGTLGCWTWIRARGSFYQTLRLRAAFLWTFTWRIIESRVLYKKSSTRMYDIRNDSLSNIVDWSTSTGRHVG